MLDFTIKQYRILLSTLLQGNYTFQTFDEFLQNPAEAILLRRLKLYDRDAENPEMQEHEPVSTDNLQLYDFVIKALNGSMSEAKIEV